MKNKKNYSDLWGLKTACRFIPKMLINILCLKCRSCSKYCFGNKPWKLHLLRSKLYRLLILNPWFNDWYQGQTMAEELIFTKSSYVIAPHYKRRWILEFQIYRQLWEEKRSNLQSLHPSITSLLSPKRPDFY